MSFNPNIPIITNPMLQSQGQIKANFQAINAVFNENHVQMNKEFQGMHNLLLFREQSGDPTTNSTQIALYTKAVSSIPNLFYRPSSNQTPIQLTYPSISTSSTASQQYSYVAGPFVVYGGLLTGIVPGASVTLTPVTTLLYVGLTILRTTNGGPTNVYSACATNIVGNSFDIQFDSSLTNQSVSYLAIGM